jgi:hypothetical protein
MFALDKMTSSENKMISAIIENPTEFYDGQIDFVVQDEELLIGRNDNWVSAYEYLLEANNFYCLADPLTGFDKLKSFSMTICSCIMKYQDMFVLWKKAEKDYMSKIRELKAIAKKKGLYRKARAHIPVAFNLDNKIICSLCDSRSEKGIKMKKCSRCLIAYYCSVECQKTHWKEHKKVCKTLN